jgi:hypothetical protein
MRIIIEITGKEIADLAREMLDRPDDSGKRLGVKLTIGDKVIAVSSYPMPSDIETSAMA